MVWTGAHFQEFPGNLQYHKKQWEIYVQPFKCPVIKALQNITRACISSALQPGGQCTVIAACVEGVPITRGSWGGPSTEESADWLGTQETTLNQRLSFPCWECRAISHLFSLYCQRHINIISSSQWFPASFMPCGSWSTSVSKSHACHSFVAQSRGLPPLLQRVHSAPGLEGAQHHVWLCRHDRGLGHVVSSSPTSSAYASLEWKWEFGGCPWLSSGCWCCDSLSSSAHKKSLVGRGFWCFPCFWRGETCFRI